MQHAEIIAKMGGPKRIALGLGIASPNTVLYWGRHGRSIPSKYWLPITEMPEAKAAGITLATLAAGCVSSPASEAA